MSELKMSKEKAMSIAARLENIKLEQEKQVAEITKLLGELKEGWIGASSTAYEQCAVNMNSNLSKFSELIQEYSMTLKNVTNGAFENDQGYANQILSKYGG